MIFDQLRKKYVRLTDEEWVRQHMISYMIHDRKIPAGLIRVESGLRYEKLRKRTDILVYDRNGAPYLMIECKSIRINLSREVLFQAGIYSKSLKVPFLGITNGMNHYFWKIDRRDGKSEILSEFPEFVSWYPPVQLIFSRIQSRFLKDKKYRLQCLHSSSILPTS